MLAACISVSSCKDPPPLDIEIWTGDSVRQSIRRGQDGQEMACFDPSFDGFKCLSDEDVKEIYQAFLQCYGKK